MRNLLALVGAAAIAFVAVGWYLGWYEVSHAPNSQGKQAIQIGINPDKISQDVKKGVERGGELVDQWRGQSPTARPNTPATNFFTPTNAEPEPNSTGGWRPIGVPPIRKNEPFGFRLPQ